MKVMPMDLFPDLVGGLLLWLAPGSWPVDGLRAGLLTSGFTSRFTLRGKQFKAVEGPTRGGIATS